MQDAANSDIAQAFSRKNEYKKHRDFLKAVSVSAKMLVKEGFADSVNEVILSNYEKQGHKDLATLAEWNSRGYSVKKGSRALPIWGKPKPLGKKKEASQPTASEEEENSFFPVCYLFSSAMVERRQPKP
jgi:hypothetical protein